MKYVRRLLGALVIAVGVLLYLGFAAHDRPALGAENALPSWNDGPNKRAILAFVASVTDERAPTFVKPPDRIAVFDNDGTLWTEQPMYAELQFSLERVRALAPQHPEWKQQQPFAAVLSGDKQALAQMSQHDAAALVAATHSGMTTDEFDRIARTWFETARNPRFGRLVRQSVYAPMIELLGCLRSNGFQTFIVSGGGVDFMRAVTTEIYGVPPAHVIGSSGKTRFELRGGRGQLVKLPEVSSIDDGEGKPINIHLHIGQRPIFAFGNSDGDLQMLQYTEGHAGARLMLLLHHDDAKREVAYDRNSKIGKLDKALDVAEESKWNVVSMKDDWTRVFPASAR